MSAFVPRYLDCRDMGHAWERANDTTRSEEGSVVSFTRSLRCTRCRTIRKDEYRVNAGEIQRRKAGYAYPEGYIVKGGLSRGEARMLLWMPRTVVRTDRFGNRVSA